jgi:hypothetical protein
MWNEAFLGTRVVQAQRINWEIGKVNTGICTVYTIHQPESQDLLQNFSWRNPAAASYT